MGRKADPNRSQRREKGLASRLKIAAERCVQIPDCENPARRKRLESDDLKWLSWYFGDGCGLPHEACYWYPFTSQQQELILAIGRAIRYGGDQGIFASRGEGKTTAAERTLLKHTLAGGLPFAVLLGATAGDAQRTLRSIDDSVKSNTRLLADYPEVCVPVRAMQNISHRAPTMTATGRWHTDRRKKFEDEPIGFTWSGEQFVFPRVPGSPSAGAIFATRGLDSSIRGLKEIGIRPKVVVIDDPDTPDTVGNPKVAAKIEDGIDLAVGGLGSQQQPVARVLLCTLPSSGVGVAHTYADPAKKPSFVSKRFSFLVQKPDRWDLWMEYVDRRQKCQRDGDKFARGAHEWYLVHRLLMDAGAEVSNPHRFDGRVLPDGTQVEVSALQHYFDRWADMGRNGERYCRTELDNEILQDDKTLRSEIVSTQMMGHVAGRPRGVLDAGTTLVVRGVDIRKKEVHYCCLASSPGRQNLIPDYDVRGHGRATITVQQAERAIEENLHHLAEEWDLAPMADANGVAVPCGLTLVDKGWKGSWRNEEGELKTWASQPVETFCMAAGLRRWLPAKGAAGYRTPAPGPAVVVGERWHMNCGVGAERACTEVIWDSDHWHLLVEELFLLPEDDADRFELFVPEPETRTAGHREFGEHIAAGAEESKAVANAGSRSRKPRFVQDHWWDALALALVARSVEQWFRAEESRRRPAGGRRYSVSF